MTTESTASTASKAPAHTKVTRQDWIDCAVAALADRPIDQLKVLPLARALGVSRSSFYWYFADQDELRSELLALWEHNTRSIIERTQRQTQTIVAACLGVFECWADQRLYVAELDLALRVWGRRDDKVARQVAKADESRLSALTEMFARHGCEDAEALVRARLLYHSQVGYYAVGTAESIETRLEYLPNYLEAMTGELPTTAELEDFKALVLAAQARES